MAIFRCDALMRARPPFIADSVEYLLMARKLVSGELMPVKSVRSGFLALLMAIPMYVERLFLPAGATVGNGGARLVPLVAWALSVLGSYRLGKLVGGAWTGLVAALFLAILPEFTFWSSDLLTDVPSAACVVWAVVFYAERRPFAAGLAIGAAVLLRYQCLIPLGALLVVPVVLRRWRDLGLMLLGLVPPAAVLGVVDWWAWNAPFHTFLQFVPKQLTTFLPPDVVQSILPFDVAVPVNAPRAVGLHAESVVAKSRAWYFLEAPTVFPWPLIGAFLLYPFARLARRGRVGTGADLTLWMTATSLLVLSIQRYKEFRYIMGVAPMIVVLAAAGAVWVAGSVAAMTRRPSVPEGSLWFSTLLVGGLGVVYAKLGWDLQRRYQYRPFGSVSEAVNTIPADRLPTSVGLAQRWIVAVDHPVVSSTDWTWVSHDIETFDLVNAGWYFDASPDDRPRFPGLDELEALDYFVVLPTVVDLQPSILRWLNERTEFDGYFYDRFENQRAALRLRATHDSGEYPREPPFWSLDDAVARTAPALARFVRGIELVSIDVTALPADAAVRVDWRWRLPADAPLVIGAGVRVTNSKQQMLALDRLTLEPVGSEGVDRIGAALRLTRFHTLLQFPADGVVHFLVRVIAHEPGVPTALPEELVVLGAGEPRAQEPLTLHVAIPIR